MAVGGKNILRLYMNVCAAAQTRCFRSLLVRSETLHTRQAPFGLSFPSVRLACMGISVERFPLVKGYSNVLRSVSHMTLFRCYSLEQTLIMFLALLTRPLFTRLGHPYSARSNRRCAVAVKGYREPAENQLKSGAFCDAEEQKGICNPLCELLET